MLIVVCQDKNTYLIYPIFLLNFRGPLKSEGGQVETSY